MTFGQIWKDEGKDEVAFDVAKNCVTSCMQLHSQGKTLYGRPWLKLNAQKGYPEFLVVEESVQFDDRETWGYEERPSKTARVDPPSGAGGDGPPAADPAEVKDEEASDDENPPVTDSDKKGKKPPLTEKQNAQRKEPLVAPNKLKPLRKGVGEACQDSTGLLSVISSVPAWSDWSNEPSLRPLREARGELEQAKQRSKFWSAWMIEDNFASYAIKNFKVREIIRMNMKIKIIFFSPAGHFAS